MASHGKTTPTTTTPAAAVGGGSSYHTPILSRGHVQSIRTKLQQSNLDRRESLTQRYEEDVEWLRRVVTLVKTKRLVAD